MVGVKPQSSDGQRKPKFERLKAYLLNQIATGRLKPGDTLPSEPHLATTMGLARNTVRRAIDGLEREGLVRRISGKGTFVSADVMARVRGENDLFALVVPEHYGLYSALLESLSSSAHRVQAQVIASTSNNDWRLQADIVLQLMERNVAGVVMVPTSHPPTPASHVTQLQRMGIPVVLCHRGVEGARAPLIRFSGSELGQLAGEALVAQGHRRIGYITQMRYGLSEQIAASLRATVEGAGGEVPEELTVFGTDGDTVLLSEEGAAAALRRLCNRDDRPTALVVTPDVLAEFTCLVLAKAGVRVPQDISIVGFGESLRRSPFQKSLTSVVIDEQEVGHRAFEMLREMSLQQRDVHSNAVVTVPLQVSSGTSVGPVPATVGAFAI